ncbi:MAG: TetR/AcrR family transcriptional regulator [Novosphingobium sp.]|uniref:TetR/AcrR family transcriptional regulator n=1 Tax=Tsuneonella sp. CC-YZS046 TaxID=3042152 RepID=UPI002D769488|nr:TetR/AcrR family transcriptional regulator [Tsuneonella sp. CC-YZS046]WRO65235.1 TetR/AcrR family transcriptional regulator [Tsuneonella sp. CC-YZS046]
MNENLAIKGVSKAKPRMTQAERTALSDARMYEAAMQLIVERGTHNTTLKDVGERAGYSRGLASNRFGSKEVLFSQMVRDFNRKWASGLKGFVEDRTGLAAFMSAFDAVEYFLMNHTIEMQALYILWFESMTSHTVVRRRLAANHSAYRRDAERWVREGIEEGAIRPSIDPSCFAVEFAALIFGLVYQWLVDPSAINIHAVFQHYRRSTLEILAERRP